MVNIIHIGKTVIHDSDTKMKTNKKLIQSEYLMS